jgi:hypothetical protein
MKEMSRLLEKLIAGGKRLIGHNVTAELRCIKQLVNRDYYKQALTNVGDTMLLHSVIEPDLDHTLSFTARYALDGISEWKWMGEHPAMVTEYNRLDVYYMTRAYKNLLGMRDVLPHNFLLPYKDALVALPRMMDIEDHGIRVDRVERDHLHRKFDVTIYDAQESVNRELKSQLDLRLAETNSDVAVTQARIDELLNDAREEARSLKTCDCAITFKTKPKKCPYCLAAYNDFVAPALAHAKTLRAHKGKVKKLSISIVETGFRIGNDEDVRWYLRDVLDVKTKRTTDTGKMGVGVDDLEPFKDDPVIQHVWAAKHAKKMKSTFLDIPVDEQGFSHPRVNIHGAATGRPSSGRDKSAADDKAGSQSLAFNAFNLPEEIRSMFVPDDIDHVFVAGDYKDLEGRLVALDSGCRKLCEWYEEGKDVHSEVAALIFGCKPDEARIKTLTFGSRVWPLRDLAKRAAHGDRYGMGLRRMCKLLHIPLAQGKEIRKALRELLPEVYIWQQSIATEVFGESRLDPRKGRRIWTKPPTRVVITKQQRVRYFPGVQNRVLKHAFAMRPQSHGAWIWYTLVDRLCVPWSTELRSGTGRFVIGTYDSAALSTRYDLATETASFLRQAAEAEMTMFRDLPGAKYMRPVFPMDIKTGPNFAFPKEDKIIDYREDDDEEDSDE